MNSFLYLLNLWRVMNYYCDTIQMGEEWRPITAPTHSLRVKIPCETQQKYSIYIPRV